MKKRLLKTAVIAVLSLSALTATAQDKPHCKAIIKAGTPCKMAPMKGKEYCTIHNPDAFRCGAITKSGKPCQMIVKNAGDKCRFHKEN